MLEKIGRLAEKAASNVNVSRRGFFGRLGKAALAVAGGLGFSVATAEGGAGGVWCCSYSDGPSQNLCFDYAQFCSTKKCPYSYHGLPLVQKTKVANCTYCPDVYGTRCI